MDDKAKKWIYNNIGVFLEKKHRKWVCIIKNKSLSDKLMVFIKGIIVGFGGISPGLSGSVLLIIFGLYRTTLEYLGSLVVDFKKKIKFLLPLVSGMILGVLLFSKLINFLLESYEMQTRFAFLGLIVGTVPMLYKEVKKEGFKKLYYVVMVGAGLFGIYMFYGKAASFPQVTDPTIIHSIILGFLVVATAIIPGLDPAVVLTSLGFYKLYVNSLATLNITVLLPMVIGVVIGAVVISCLMTYLFKRFYTFVYSCIFGVFIAMIPNMLNSSCKLNLDIKSVVSILVMIIGFCISLGLSNIQEKYEYKNNQADEN
jgi:putative membrane protein